MLQGVYYVRSSKPHSPNNKRKKSQLSETKKYEAKNILYRNEGKDDKLVKYRMFINQKAPHYLSSNSIIYSLIAGTACNKSGYLFDVSLVF